MIINSTFKENGISVQEIAAFLTPTRLQIVIGTAMVRAAAARKLLEAQFPWAR